MYERKDEKVFHSLKNTRIGVFLSEHQYIEGLLLDVKQDHIIVDVDHDIYYISDKYIQSITKNAKDFYVASEVVPYIDRQYLSEVLKEMQESWVIINGPGHRAFCGVFSKIIDDYIILISQQEILYIPKYLIFNICSIMSEDQILLKNQKLLEEQKLLVLTKDIQVDETDREDSTTSLISVAQEHVSESKELTLPAVQEVEAVPKDDTTEEELKVDCVSDADVEHTEVNVSIERPEVPSEDKKVQSQSTQSEDNTKEKSVTFDSDELKLEVQHEKNTEGVLEIKHGDYNKLRHPMKIEFINSIDLSIDDGKDNSQLLISDDKSNEIKTIQSETENKPSLKDKKEEIKCKQITEEMVEGNRMELETKLIPLEDEETDIQPILAVVEATKYIDFSSEVDNEITEKACDYGDSRVDQNSILDFKDSDHRKIKSCAANKTINHERHEKIMVDNNDISEKHEKLPVAKEQNKLTESNQTHTPMKQLSRKEEKEMLQEQYSALIKHATEYIVKMKEQSNHTNVFNDRSAEELKQHEHTEIETLQPLLGNNKLIDSKTVLEGQYIALMNHAAKMYWQLQD